MHPRPSFDPSDLVTGVVNDAAKNELKVRQWCNNIIEVERKEAAQVARPGGSSIPPGPSQEKLSMTEVVAKLDKTEPR